jgi:hypothetical protein
MEYMWIMKRQILHMWIMFSSALSLLGVKVKE